MMTGNFSLGLVAVLWLCAASSIVSAKKPNILMIFADDVGTGDVPGYWDNSGLVRMPNLEQLVENGTTFTDAHSTPLCAPSRYVLLSGNYQHRGEKFGGSWTVNYEGNQFRKKQQSIAQVLRNNDYGTAMFGKWHLGGKIPSADGYNLKDSSKLQKPYMISQAGHDWRKPVEQGPWDIGFETSYITFAGVQNPPYAFVRNDIMEVDLNNITFWEVGNYSTPSGISKIESSGEGDVNWESSAYNMILLNETKTFIDSHLEKNPSKPFFTYVALGAVHTPNSPPDFFIDGTPIAGQYATPHMDVLSELDLIVGSLIKKLDEKGILEDTIIVFTSDNGGLGLYQGVDSELNGHYSSGPLRAEKASIYEGGHRIPMTIRWDGNVPKGETRSHIVGLNDLFKTLCDLVGVTVPRNQAIDSTSFANYLIDGSDLTGLRDSLGSWSFVKYRNSFRLGQEAIRVGSLKLIHDYQNETFELYDLDNDISERNNLITSVNETLINEMYDELLRIGPCHDRTGSFYVRKQKRKRSCQWFGKKSTFKRCNKFKEGITHCRLTCALKNSPQCKKISDLKK